MFALQNEHISKVGVGELLGVKVRTPRGGVGAVLTQDPQEVACRAQGMVW